jgi:hypothetical protein
MGGEGQGLGDMLGIEEYIVWVFRGELVRGEG